MIQITSVTFSVTIRYISSLLRRSRSACSLSAISRVSSTVRREIKSGIVWTCARQARFRMLNCYGTEKIGAGQRQAFLGRVEQAVRKL